MGAAVPAWVYWGRQPFPHRHDPVIEQLQRLIVDQMSGQRWHRQRRRSRVGSHVDGAVPGVAAIEPPIVDDVGTVTAVRAGAPPSSARRRDPVFSPALTMTTRSQSSRAFLNGSPHAMASDAAPSALRAVIYARVSSAAQRDRQTIASQISTLPTFIASRGWILAKPPSSRVGSRPRPRPRRSSVTLRIRKSVPEPMYSTWTRARLGSRSEEGARRSRFRSTSSSSESRS